MSLFERQATPEEKAVFGWNVRIDPKTNRPIEMGIGSKGNEGPNHFGYLAKSLEAEEKADIERALRKAAKKKLDDDEKF